MWLDEDDDDDDDDDEDEDDDDDDEEDVDVVEEVDEGGGVVAFGASMLSSLVVGVDEGDTCGDSFMSR